MISSVEIVQRKPSKDDGKTETAASEDRDRKDHYGVIFVWPKLIGYQDEFFREMILGAGGCKLCVGWLESKK